MIENLIQRYKEIKRKHGHNDEIYKYNAIQHFQENWNADAEDFAGMLKEALSKQTNLIYNLASGTILHLSRKKPKETRNLFKYLFDEKIELVERITKFDKKTDKLFKSIEPSSNGFQDERTASVYLTFRYPEKYTFFKDSFYSKFCKLINEKKARKGQKYAHYLKLIEDFKEKYVLQDEELFELTNAILPENVWQDKNRNILAQDVLFYSLDAYPEPNYWVFQGNPSVFDFKSALSKELIEDWTVTAHKNKIVPGDKLILWITGEKSGCYALAEVTTKPYETKPAKDDHLWKVEDTHDQKAGIIITHNLVDNPILKEQVLSLPEFADFKGGNQGTNFIATKEQYETIEMLIKVEKMKNVKYDFAEWLQLNAPPSYRNYIGKSVDNIVQRLEEIDSFFPNNSLYKVDIRNLPEKIQEIKVLVSKENRDKNYEFSQYDSKRGSGMPKAILGDKNYIQFLRTLKGDIKVLSDKEVEYELLANNREKQISVPQNLILYGPPGTGKTYQLTNDYIHFFYR